MTCNAELRFGRVGDGGPPRQFLLACIYRVRPGIGPARQKTRLKNSGRAKYVEIIHASGPWLPAIAGACQFGRLRRGITAPTVQRKNPEVKVNTVAGATARARKCLQA